MALYDTISNALGSEMANNGEEISLKIKPAGMAAGQASNEVANGAPSATGTATGGGGSAGGGSALTALGTPTPSPGSAVPAGQRLGQNPQLVAPPMGAYTDAEFEAQLAQARQQTQTQYLDILQQLGFVGADGNFVPGLVELAAQRQRSDLQHNQGLAAQEVTNNARRGGTVFSGRRIQNQANAEHPFVQALAQLESDTPLKLGGLYQQAMGLKSAFEAQLNVLLAEAASRQAQSIREKPSEPAAITEMSAGPEGGPSIGNLLGGMGAGPHGYAGDAPQNSLDALREYLGLTGLTGGGGGGGGGQPHMAI